MQADWCVRPTRPGRHGGRPLRPPSPYALKPNSSRPHDPQQQHHRRGHFDRSFQQVPQQLISRAEEGAEDHYQPGGEA